MKLSPRDTVFSFTATFNSLGLSIRAKRQATYPFIVPEKIRGQEMIFLISSGTKRAPVPAHPGKHRGPEISIPEFKPCDIKEEFLIS